MLKRDKFKLVIVLLALLTMFSCDQSTNEKADQDNEDVFFQKSRETIGSEEYDKMYSSINDSLQNWLESDVLKDTVCEKGDCFFCTYKLDSLLLFNSKKNKVLGCLHQINGINKLPVTSDGVLEFLGAKVDGKWYYWTAGFMPVIRKGFKGHDPKKPLSYVQLHSEALRFLGGYLTTDGQINDQLFESKFKSGCYTFKQRYQYKWILDGNRIDNESDYWNYSYKKRGLGLWLAKAYNDSIAKSKK